MIEMKGRWLGLDPGEKKIGLALSDPLGLFAQPFKMITFRGKRDLLAQLSEIVEKEGVKGLVIGLALNKDGKAGKVAQQAKELADFLQKKLNLPCKMMDERYSSKQAESLLKSGKVSPRKQKTLTHQLSAAIILQTFLESESRL